MILVSMMKFEMGHLIITPAALEAIPADDICESINRHVCGDFGDLDNNEQHANEQAVKFGLLVCSTYHTATGTKFFVLTSADRSVTVLLATKI